MKNQNIQFWNCNSPRLKNFIESKGIIPVKTGTYPDGVNWWAYVYADIQDVLDEYQNINK